MKKMITRRNFLPAFLPLLWAWLPAAAPPAALPLLLPVLPLLPARLLPVQTARSTT